MALSSERRRVIWSSSLMIPDLTHLPIRLTIEIFGYQTIGNKRGLYIFNFAYNRDS